MSIFTETHKQESAKGSLSFSMQTRIARKLQSRKWMGLRWVVKRFQSRLSALLRKDRSVAVISSSTVMEIRLIWWTSYHIIPPHTQTCKSLPSPLSRLLIWLWQICLRWRVRPLRSFKIWKGKYQSKRKSLGLSSAFSLKRITKAMFGWNILTLNQQLGLSKS